MAAVWQVIGQSTCAELTAAAHCSPSAGLQPEGWLTIQINTTPHTCVHGGGGHLQTFGSTQSLTPTAHEKHQGWHVHLSVPTAACSLSSSTAGAAVAVQMLQQTLQEQRRQEQHMNAVLSNCIITNSITATL
jgi:hypothetical protein